jgi:hypothetical protein
MNYILIPHHVASVINTIPPDAIRLLMTARTAQVLRWILRIAITVLFTVMVNRGINRRQLTILGDHLMWGWVIAAFFMGLLSLLFQLLRWREILRIEGFGNSLLQAFKTFAWGHLLAFITPGRIGEFGRALALDSKRKADSVASVVIDKTFAVLAMAVCGAAGMAGQFWTLGSQPPRRLTLCMVLFCIAVPLVLVGIRVRAGNPAAMGKIGSIVHRLREIIVAIPRFMNSRIVIYSLAAQVALLVQTAMILSVFGNASFYSNMIIAAEVYAFMLFLPFFIANIGLREYSFSMMFENIKPLFHQSLAMGSVALGVSFLILCMNILFPAAVGLCIMIIDKKHGSTI